MKIIKNIHDNRSKYLENNIDIEDLEKRINNLRKKDFKFFLCAVDPSLISAYSNAREVADEKWQIDNIRNIIFNVYDYCKRNKLKFNSIAFRDFSDDSNNLMTQFKNILSSRTEELRSFILTKVNYNHSKKFSAKQIKEIQEVNLQKIINLSDLSSTDLIAILAPELKDKYDNCFERFEDNWRPATMREIILNVVNYCTKNNVKFNSKAFQNNLGDKRARNLYSKFHLRLTDKERAVKMAKFLVLNDDKSNFDEILKKIQKISKSDFVWLIYNLVPNLEIKYTNRNSIEKNNWNLESIEEIIINVKNYCTANGIDFCSAAFLNNCGDDRAKVLQSKFHLRLKKANRTEKLIKYILNDKSKYLINDINVEKLVAKIKNIGSNDFKYLVWAFLPESKDMFINRHETAADNWSKSVITEIILNVNQYCKKQNKRFTISSFRNNHGDKRAYNLATNFSKMGKYLKIEGSQELKNNSESFLKLIRAFSPESAKDYEINVDISKNHGLISQYTWEIALRLVGSSLGERLKIEPNIDNKFPDVVRYEIDGNISIIIDLKLQTSTARQKSRLKYQRLLKKYGKEQKRKHLVFLCLNGPPRKSKIDKKNNIMISYFKLDTFIASWFSDFNNFSAVSADPVSHILKNVLKEDFSAAGIGELTVDQKIKLIPIVSFLKKLKDLVSSDKNQLGGEQKTLEELDDLFNKIKSDLRDLAKEPGVSVDEIANTNIWKSLDCLM